MKKNLYFAVVICIVLTLAAAGSAAAQWEDEDEPSRFGLSMSLFRPSKSELSDIADVWLGPVLTYHIKFDENQRPVILASAGFIGKERNSLRKVSMIPLTITGLKRTGDSESNWYFGGGVGAYYTNYRNFPVSESGFSAGLHIIGGKEFKKGVYAEVRYDMIPGSGDVKFSGISINAGYRRSL